MMISIDRKARIVCTIGPATESVEMLNKLIDAGMNVVRLNTSHGDMNFHSEMIKRVKKIREERKIPISILLDLAGPKIRTGNFSTDYVILKEGNNFILTSEDIVGDETKVSVSYKEIIEDLNVGDIILLDDGKIKLEVVEKKDKELITKILVGGKITHRRGINIPRVDTRIPSLTDRDKEFLKLAVEHEVDYIAQSFVRKPEDILETKDILKDLGKPDIPIIAKIETFQAVGNLEEILKVADGAMVARGDLGVEIPLEEVPIIQKRIISICNKMAKPVITATQMLETMIENPFPTRAETTDIANAILDGTDAVMLSAETSVGKYPIEAVKTMDRIIKTTERYLKYYHFKFEYPTEKSITDAITKAAIDIIDDLNMDTIVAMTYSGYTARAISRYRRDARIVAITPNERVYNRMALVWGVTPIIVKEYNNLDEMIKNIENILKDRKCVKKGERIIIIAGIPYGFATGKTNLIKVHEIE